MKTRCMNLLIAEHKVILRAVDVLSEIANQTAGGRQLNKDDVRGLLDIFRVYADELHQGKEEGALFPVFTARCDPGQLESVRHMLFEHEQDRSLMQGMEDALLTSNGGEFNQYAMRFAEILRNHIYKEDNILFELVDKRLSPEDDNRIVRQFEAFDRDFNDRGQDRLLHRLRMLEWKYLRKAA